MRRHSVPHTVVVVVVVGFNPLSASESMKAAVSEMRQRGVRLCGGRGTSRDTDHGSRELECLVNCDEAVDIYNDHLWIIVSAHRAI